MSRSQCVVPRKLQSGDLVRVVAPSTRLCLPADQVAIAGKRFEEFGLRLSFGEWTGLEPDLMETTSVESRVRDLHAAFEDPEVSGILTLIGGYNSNQLLRHLDWDLIARYPKIFCGYSDITALNNAIFARTGLVSYSGPHYSSFSQKLHMEYTIDSFRSCVMSDGPYEMEPSSHWSDDAWYEDQEARVLETSPGWLVLNEGEAEGTVLGGNLCTFNLLQGTEFMPDLNGAVLFLEDDFLSNPVTFDRDLQSLIHQPGFEGVQGLVIGRFQRASGMTDEILTHIVRTKPELAGMPVVANVNFGHADPKMTLPIGGTARLEAVGGEARIKFPVH